MRGLLRLWSLGRFGRDTAPDLILGLYGPCARRRDPGSWPGPSREAKDTARIGAPRLRIRSGAGLVLAVFAVFFTIAMPANAYQETVAFEEEPLLSVIVEPEDIWSGGAYVQGEIVVTVRVSSLLPFEALNVEMPVIEGARVETLIKPRMRKVKSYAGDGYVLERVIAIYPQTSGTLTIPPIRATGRVEPEKDKPLDFIEESPAITMEIAGIDPRYGADWWMVSRSVTTAETWSIPVEDLREGDIVRREITVTAQGVPHDRMPEIKQSRTQGIEVSDAGTTGNTQRTNDGVLGTVTRAWDLKIGVGDTLFVAPIGISYWDPVERREKKAGVRGYRIEPLPPDQEAIAMALMVEAAEQRAGARWIALGAGAVIALPAVAALLAWLWALIPTRADRRLRAAFRNSADAMAQYRAATDWALESGLDPRRIGTDGGAGELTRYLFASGTEPKVPAQIARSLTRLSRRERVRAMGGLGRRFAAGLFGISRRLNSRIG